MKKNTRKNKAGLLLAAATLLGSSFTANAAADPFLGEIMWVGYNFCPRGWADANGQLLPIAQNDALFSLYGTIYGGDGRTTFALPDLRGRVPIHHGQGPSLTNRRMGAKGGAEKITLTEAQLPAHSHQATDLSVTLKASSEKGDLAEPENSMLADGQRAAIYADEPADETKLVSMSGKSAEVSGSTSSAGGGQAVATLPPYLVLRACIATQGIYPSRN